MQYGASPDWTPNEKKSSLRENIKHRQIWVEKWEFYPFFNSLLERDSNKIQKFPSCGNGHQSLGATNNPTELGGMNKEQNACNP